MEKAGIYQVVDIGFCKCLKYVHLDLVPYDLENICLEKCKIDVERM